MSDDEGAEVVTQTPTAVPPPVPPAPEFLYEWWPAETDDPTVRYLLDEVWKRPARAPGCDCARLSKAAYVYRERATGQRALAKFYAAKTPAEPERHAEHEVLANRVALAAGLDGGPTRACQVFGAWRGVVILDYIDGLTLDDTIAIRRDRPGTLGPALEAASCLLAILHRNGARTVTEAQIPRELSARIPLADARSFLDDLTRSSVLAGEALISDGLLRQLDQWARGNLLDDFQPTLIHGDATTTNFVFPSASEVVAIDWERLAVGDPADDLGRLAAEVANGIRGHGGPAAEAEAAVDRVLAAYRSASPDGCCGEGFAKRLRFHRAASTLRMARNGWLPQLERTRLIAQASALLVLE